MRARRRGPPQHRTEAARVVVAKDGAVFEFQIDVIVRPPRRRVAVYAQASGHAEMNDQRVAAEPEKQVFAAPVDAVDDAADQTTGQIARNRPAQPAVVDPDRRHFLPFYVRRDPATRGFNFRKFGHLGASNGVWCSGQYTLRCSEVRRWSGPQSRTDRAWRPSLS